MCHFGNTEENVKWLLIVSISNIFYIEQQTGQQMFVEIEKFSASLLDLVLFPIPMVATSMMAL